MRLGEIVGLSANDISFTQGSITIHRQWLEKDKCYGPTKNNLSRIIYFDKGSYIEDCFRSVIDRNSSNLNPQVLITNTKGNRESCRKLSSYHFQGLVKKLDLPKIRFHDLRHTFASWFMIKNDNIWRLKEILGHSDIQVTQRYTHLSKKNRIIFSSSWE